MPDTNVVNLQTLRKSTADNELSVEFCSMKPT